LCFSVFLHSSYSLLAGACRSRGTRLPKSGPDPTTVAYECRGRPCPERGFSSRLTRHRCRPSIDLANLSEALRSLSAACGFSPMLADSRSNDDPTEIGVGVGSACSSPSFSSARASIGHPKPPRRTGDRRAPEALLFIGVRRVAGTVSGCSQETDPNGRESCGGANLTTRRPALAIVPL
jgi:hypothetical protein